MLCGINITSMAKHFLQEAQSCFQVLDESLALTQKY